MSPYLTLYISILLYSIASLTAWASVMTRDARPQQFALGVMISGFITHTIWIGTICVRTHHPPLTNLAEASAFLAWTILLVELILFFKFRVHAAAFFVYPLAVLLLVVAAIAHEPYAIVDPAVRSNLFIAHVFFTVVGIAMLIVSLAFAILYRMQERALKAKTRGALWDWIPSLKVCDMVSFRGLVSGFAVYTIGLVLGIIWSYRKSSELMSLRSKEIAAVVAWLLFAALLQSYLSGRFRQQRTIFISVAAFLSLLVAMLGIHHV